MIQWCFALLIVKTIFIEVDIDMLLTGGVPIDTESGDDLEFIGTYLIDESVPSGNYIFTDNNGIDSLV